MPFVRPAAAVAAIGLGFGLACAAPGSPVKVVIVTAGAIDPKLDGRVAIELGNELRDVGFTVAVDPEPIGTTELEPAQAEARKRASSAHAAHAVLLRPSSKVEREGVVAGTSLYQVRLDADVVEPDGPVPTLGVEFAFEDSAPAEVERNVSDAWVHTVAPWLIQQLSTTPAMADVQPVDLEVTEMEGWQRLRELETMVGTRSELALHFDDYCGRLPTMEPGVTCFTSPCKASTIVGVDPSDRILVQDTSRIPIFPIPLKDGVWREPPESLYAVRADAPLATQLLLRSPNFYGFAEVATDGEFGAVETFGVGRVTGIEVFSVADGHRSALATLKPGEASRFSRADPSGNAVIACLDGGGCFYDAGAGRVALREFTNAALVALPDGTKVFGQLASGDLAVDPLDGTPGVTVRQRDHLGSILGARDGKLRATLANDDGCALGAVDPATGKLDRTPMPCLQFPRAAADGRIVGTLDGSVVAWTPGAAEPVTVTSGLYDEYAYPTRDGRVAFNRRLDSPPEFGVDLGVRVVCVASLP